MVCARGECLDAKKMLFYYKFITESVFYHILVNRTHTKETLLKFTLKRRKVGSAKTLPFCAALGGGLQRLVNGVLSPWLFNPAYLVERFSLCLSHRC